MTIWQIDLMDKYRGSVLAAARRQKNSKQWLDVSFSSKQYSLKYLKWRENIGKISAAKAKASIFISLS